jgi:hypothetical protein
MFNLSFSITPSATATVIGKKLILLPKDRIPDYWFDANNLDYVYSDPFQNTNITSSGQAIGYMIDVAESNVV